MIISHKDGKCYNYEDFKTIYDMCHALIEVDVAEKDAIDILIEFRIIVPDNK